MLSIPSTMLPLGQPEGWSQFSYERSALYHEVSTKFAEIACRSNATAFVVEMCQLGVVKIQAVSARSEAPHRLGWEILAVGLQLSGM